MEAARQIQSSSAQPALVDAPGKARLPVDIHAVTEKWDTLVERLRHAGKTLIATALEHSTPTVVTARGDVTITLDEPNDIYAKAIQNGVAEIVAILREWFVPVERLLVEGTGRVASGPPKRMTDEMVKAEKLAALKKKDPALAAAIDELDLEVID